MSSAWSAARPTPAAARKVVEAGGSLRDLQQLLGHKDLSTTQKYIDGSEDAKRRLIQLI